MKKVVLNVVACSMLGHLVKMAYGPTNSDGVEADAYSAIHNSNIHMRAAIRGATADSPYLETLTQPRTNKYNNAQTPGGGSGGARDGEVLPGWQGIMWWMDPTNRRSQLQRSKDWPRKAKRVAKGSGPEAGVVR